MSCGFKRQPRACVCFRAHTQTDNFLFVALYLVVFKFELEFSCILAAVCCLENSKREEKFVANSKNAVQQTFLK